MKSLLSIEPFENNSEKKKFCLSCGRIATEVASFQVEGATVIERYCKNCVKAVR